MLGTQAAGQFVNHRVHVRLLQKCSNTSILELFTQQTRFSRLSDTILGRIDDMGSKIDDLEKSIAELMDQAGIEPADVNAANKPKA